VISDVHGNRWALERVLEDIRGRGVAGIVNLGDCLYGPLDPAGTAEILMGLDLPTVSGNEDRLVVDPPADPSPALRFTLDRLAERHIAWLASLPLTRLEDDRLLCHGTPHRDDEYLLHTIDRSGARPRPIAELSALLAGVRASVVLCGHDHLPGRALTPEGTLVLNPGSVGCPAYVDDAPHPHQMAAGSPHARYCLLGGEESDLEIEAVSLEYDWNEAAATAEAHGFPDWALWIATGRTALP